MMRKTITLTAVLLLFVSFSPAQDSLKLTATQIAERNKPATVLIETAFNGWVYTTAAESNLYAQNQLRDELEYQIVLGKLKTADYWTAFILTLGREPQKYFYKGKERTANEFTTTAIGSGFIITPDGYVVTNCHVVDESDAVMQQQFVLKAMRQKIEDYLNRWEKNLNRKLIKAEEDALTDVCVWYYTHTMEVSDVTKTYNVVLGVNGPGGKIIAEKIKADLITRGNSIPGKDVAILKLNRGQNYPTVRIGHYEDMRIGDEVFALGYPGVATFHELLSEESVTEATMTRGIVSAKKYMKDGWEVLQTDAAITHGNSGGPVFNENGEVIGLATFGSIDRQRQQEVQGMNFIVPSAIVEEFIRKSNITPMMSDASLAFEEALKLYDKSWYNKALQKFEEVRQMNSGYPFIDQYIASARTRIDKGLDQEPILAAAVVIAKPAEAGEWEGLFKNNYVLFGGGVLVLIIIVLSALLVRKNKPSSLPTQNQES